MEYSKGFDHSSSIHLCFGWNAMIPVPLMLLEPGQPCFLLGADIREVWYDPMVRSMVFPILKNATKPHRPNPVSEWFRSGEDCQVEQTKTELFCLANQMVSSCRLTRRCRYIYIIYKYYYICFAHSHWGLKFLVHIWCMSTKWFPVQSDLTILHLCWLVLLVSCLTKIWFSCPERRWQSPGTWTTIMDRRCIGCSWICEMLGEYVRVAVLAKVVLFPFIAPKHHHPAWNMFFFNMQPKRDPCAEFCEGLIKVAFLVVLVIFGLLLVMNSGSENGTWHWEFGKMSFTVIFGSVTIIGGCAAALW